MTLSVLVTAVRHTWMPSYLPNFTLPTKMRFKLNEKAGFIENDITIALQFNWFDFIFSFSLFSPLFCFKSEIPTIDKLDGKIKEKYIRYNIALFVKVLSANVMVTESFEYRVATYQLFVFQICDYRWKSSIWAFFIYKYFIQYLSIVQTEWSISYRITNWRRKGQCLHNHRLVQVF